MLERDRKSERQSIQLLIESYRNQACTVTNVLPCVINCPFKIHGRSNIAYTMSRDRNAALRRNASTMRNNISASCRTIKKPRKVLTTNISWKWKKKTKEMISYRLRRSWLWWPQNHSQLENIVWEDVESNKKGAFRCSYYRRWNIVTQAMKAIHEIIFKNSLDRTIGHECAGRGRGGCDQHFSFLGSKCAQST